MDVRVVERALPDVAAAVDERPGGAGVFAAEQATTVVLDECVDTIGVRARDRDADASVEPELRETLVARAPRPRRAAVGALEQAAAGTAAGHRGFVAEGLPHRRVHDIGICAVDADVDGSRL